MDEWLETYDSYNKALKIMPDDKVIELNKAIFLIRWGIELLKLEDYNQAMMRAEEAITLLEDKPNTYYADALALKATIYMFTENYDESLKYYDCALEFNPNDEYLQKSKEELIELMK